MSKLLPFEKLNNTRDLGGMTACRGKRIRAGKLIRSGHLYFASKKDRQTLSEQVGLILDFRTEQERKEKPDPYLDGVEYIHLPILDQLTAGITREEASLDVLIGKMAVSPEAAMGYMVGMYANFITSEYAGKQYAEMLKLLLIERKRAVLWHCTAGKDRAGFAAIIVEELLGVSREAIIEDYMATNGYLAGEVETIIAEIKKKAGLEGASADEALHLLLGTRQEYIEELYRKIEEIYGGFDGYARNVLKVDDEMKEQLREIYLES